jgi:TPR repeat protein
MNNGRANAILGQMYAEGRGVEQDFNAAGIYFNKALEKGYQTATALLARLAQKEGNVSERNYWTHQFAQSQRHSVHQVAKHE